MAEKYKDKGLVVLAVNVREPADAIRRFVTEKGLKHTILVNGGPAASLYGVRSTPTTIYINPQGVIASVESGFSPDMVPEMEKRIEGILPR